MIEIKNFGSNPGNLSMFYHQHKNETNQSKPLVVVLHGCLQNAKTVAEQSGWNKLADENNFDVLYPQQKFINNPNKCFDWFQQKNIAKDKGEVLSIKQMIDEAKNKYSIDTTKIFIYGLSAGAAMGVALMADYPALFNSGAILAGGAFAMPKNAFEAYASMTSPLKKSAKALAENVRIQNPAYKKAYPKLIVMHGKNDLIVAINNAKQLIAQWTYLHCTDSIADKTIDSFQMHGDITKYFYCDSFKNNVVIYYEVNHLGHAIMIDPGTKPRQGGKLGTFAIDKDFFSTYWIALDFGLIKE